ncbi:hypothetical protein BRD17_02970 [Halobacteriales archaeon SW_7_68_16]|nr:MAG: hypothetical protein BRD17_02970 [Halobacteriales archaeon SW_7_68_16]
MLVARRGDRPDLYLKQPGAASGYDRELGTNAVMYAAAADAIGGETCDVHFDPGTNTLVQVEIEGEDLTETDADRVDVDAARRSVARGIVLGNWDCHGDNFIVGSDGRPRAIDLDEIGSPVDPDRADELAAQGVRTHRREFSDRIRTVSKTFARKGDGALAPDDRVEVITDSLVDEVAGEDGSEPLVDDRFRERLRAAEPEDAVVTIREEIERRTGYDVEDYLALSTPEGEYEAVAFSYVRAKKKLVNRRAATVREKLRSEVETIAAETDGEAVARVMRRAARERVGIDPAEADADADDPGTELATHVARRAEIVRENVETLADPDRETIIDWKTDA